MNEESKLNLWQKMSAIQGENLDIAKDKQAHGYKYATLDKIMEALNPLLFKNKVLVYHQTGYDKEEKKTFLRTIIRDIDVPVDTIESYTLIDDKITLPGQNAFMVAGSAITYFRRYHVTSMFGLTTEEDSDAGGAKGTAAKSGKSVEAAGVEKEVDFVAIFQNMIAKGKSKELVQKQLENYRIKMNETQLVGIAKLISEMK